MGTLAITLLVAFIVAFRLTPIARRWAIQLGWVDRPDGQRKLQESPVALCGGLAVYGGMCAGIAVAMTWRGEGEPIPARLVCLVVLSGGLLGTMGLVDDALELRARTKLVLQILAVLPLAVAGYFPQELMLLGWSWPLGNLGGLLMAFWLVACINAVNLLDGYDGFASTIGIVIALGVVFVALTSGNFGTAAFACALAGALLGFIPYNLSPASIYLGDAGSMLVGLTLGVVTALSTDVHGSGVPLLVPLSLMTIPLWDTALAIFRRKATGRSLGAGDRKHLHHRLSKICRSPREVLIVGGGATAITCAAAWLARNPSHTLITLLTLGIPIVALFACRACGRHEFWVLRRTSASALIRFSHRLVSPVGAKSMGGHTSIWERAWHRLALHSVISMRVEWATRDGDIWVWNRESHASCDMHSEASKIGDTVVTARKLQLSAESGAHCLIQIEMLPQRHHGAIIAVNWVMGNIVTEANAWMNQLEKGRSHEGLRGFTLTRSALRRAA